jgi:hypothetical protein
MSLLRARRDKIAEIGVRKIVRLVRLMHRHNTPCFFAELEDGTQLDFSFYKAIEELARPKA